MLILSHFLPLLRTLFLTHTYTHTQTYTPTHTHAHTLSLSISLSHTHPLTLPSYLPQHAFLTRASSAGLPPSHSAVLTLAALDGGAKIYCVRAHPTQPHLLAVGTSIGTIVLSLSPSQVQ